MISKQYILLGVSKIIWTMVNLQTTQYLRNQVAQVNVLFATQKPVKTQKDLNAQYQLVQNKEHSHKLDCKELFEMFSFETS